MKQQVDILIVDDRLDGLITLEAVINMPDINLVKAQSGREALLLLDLYDFGMILLDVQMPELDGFETAQLIRQHDKYKSTPIIFVTAINKDDQYIYRGYEVGAVDYVFKPFEPQILRSKVNVFIELFRKTQQLQKQAELIRESERRERYLRLAELEVESLRRYRNLADAIPHIVWRAKGDGTLDYFNKVWSDYTGLSLETSFGNGWQSAFQVGDLNGFLKTWMISMRQGESFQTECRIIRQDGQERWFWIKAVCEKNQSEQVVAWIGTCTDIHDRKTAELRLINAEKQANAASLSKTSFLANMSHEIRTPMNAILGFTELMLEADQSTEERIDCVHIVQRNGRQLLKIIDEILDISKVESGRLEIERVEVNTLNLLEDVKSLMRLSALDKGLEFSVILKSAIPRVIFTDPTRLRQILLNLVGNAIKFTPQGSVKLEVEWFEATGETPPRMVATITDTGVGIQVANTAHLFQPFMQEDSATTRNFGGTGLGLALSRQLARAMKGNVFLKESTPGKGSCFTLEIEAIPVMPTDFVQNFPSDLDKKDRLFSRGSEKRLAGMKILLVEDVPDNQVLMLHFLGLAGAEVEVANNGKEGMTKALAGTYDAVLMDIQMPILDGYEATRGLREQGFTVPIIALTAHALNEEREKILSMGCDGYLSKPVEYNILVENLANIGASHV